MLCASGEDCLLAKPSIEVRYALCFRADAQILDHASMARDLPESSTTQKQCNPKRFL